MDEFFNFFMQMISIFRKTICINDAVHIFLLSDSALFHTDARIVWLMNS